MRLPSKRTIPKAHNTYELELFKNLERAIRALPFGESAALPWCIEAFPQLVKTLSALEGYHKTTNRLEGQ